MATGKRAASGRLAEYRRKRDFSRTPEPAGGPEGKSGHLRFVVQMHDASRLHYDFRLEWDGVLKSWATPKGPSMNPADKRLAVQTEDHPVDYGSFEGNIPAGEYGGGAVLLWDRGAWTPLPGADVDRDLARGRLKFVLLGERLRGGFTLVRIRDHGAVGNDKNWLLIKEKDELSAPGWSIAPFDTSIATGRTLDQIAAGQPGKQRLRKSGNAMPEFVAPQLATTAQGPPPGEDWLHEIKFDGYRLQIRVADGAARIRTRSGLDWTRRFSAIAAAAGKLEDGIYDGEAVVLDQQGRPDFALLQQALEAGQPDRLVFFAFDLLWTGMEDIRSLGLTERKRRLKGVLSGVDGALRYVDHFTTAGDAVLRSACRMALEGIVSKRADAPYRSGRSDAWRKAKCRGRDEFVVGGFTRLKKAGVGVGALLVGARREGQLVYVGRVGSGYSGQAAARLAKRLAALRQKTSPFAGKPPERTAGVVWVAPELVAEVEYAGFTGDGLLRQASYKGLRDDKAAAAVVSPQEARQTVAGVAISNPDKVLWPDGGQSKLDLAHYFATIADLMLPHVGGRPVSLVRAPDGIAGQRFFQRHAMPGQSALIKPAPVRDGKKPYMYIDDLPGLVALAQFGAIEIHPWGAPVADVERPDQLTFDLDPDEGLDFKRVVEAARVMRAALDAVDLPAFLKSTGGKGLHVVAPLRPSATWPAAKAFARALCERVAAEAPDRFVTTMAKRQRVGRIFLDYLRNDRTSTAVAAYSPRARPGAPVAAPLDWTALGRFRPGQWTIADAARLAKRKDPWADFHRARQPLDRRRLRLVGL